MKFSWVIAVSLLFAGTVFADDEKGKTDGKGGAKVETKSTATVTVVVVDEDGKVVEKTETSESNVGGANRIQVQVIDGKQIVEVTLPDGTKKKIGINVGGAGEPAGRVMRWVFREDGDNGTRIEEVAQVKERVEKLLKNVDVDIKIDAENIANQVEAAMIKIRPFMVEERKVGEEMLVELSDQAFLIHEDDGEGEPAEDGDTQIKMIPRRIQVHRIGGQGMDTGMVAVLKKLDEMSKRLEKIEARLDELTKE